MSVELMGAVFQLALPPGPKLLLLALADNANDGGHAWPSQDTLAQKVSATTRSVRTQTRILEAEDWLGITEGQGRGHSIHYYLNVEKIKAEVGAIKAEKAEVDAEKRKLTTRKAEVGEPGTISEPSIEPSIEKPLVSPLAKSPSKNPRWEPTPDFITEMAVKYQDIWSAEHVAELIADAWNHKAKNKAVDKRRYVETWLRRDAERSVNGHHAGRGATGDRDQGGLEAPSDYDPTAYSEEERAILAEMDREHAEA